MKRFDRKLWIGIAVMAILCPLGVVLPVLWKAEGAWGEWDAAALRGLLGYVPEGLRKMAGFWSAPIQGYQFGAEGASLVTKAVYYFLSGAVGLGLVVAAIFIISRLVFRNDR